MVSENIHKTMVANKSKDTKPELIVRKYLWSHGYRYRLNYKRLPGKPDVVLRKYRTCIFVNGCFWHGHDECGLFTMPKSNLHYWKPKITRNKERDVEVQQNLASMGWHSIVIWECQLKPKLQQQTLDALLRTLNIIQLENMHAKIKYNINEEDVWRGVAAEDDY